MQPVHQFVQRAIVLQNVAYPGFFKRVSETLELNQTAVEKYTNNVRMETSDYASYVEVKFQHSYGGSPIQSSPLSLFPWQLEYLSYRMVRDSRHPNLQDVDSTAVVLIRNVLGVV